MDTLSNRKNAGGDRRTVREGPEYSVSLNHQRSNGTPSGAGGHLCSREPLALWRQRELTQESEFTSSFGNKH